MLVNPPHTAIGSRVSDDHQPPLRLLAIGGRCSMPTIWCALVDAGFGWSFNARGESRPRPSSKTRVPNERRLAG
ncbi:hypothetical protein [Mesorhizobium silamurunense]|uniref:hypothetical protein n=1 Tax=Mesorhizobium silamurunense TaxID=499528 RepID=UPI00178320D1|nr:hypothetical protein [Mesorhizobium silamurunense]